MERDRDAGMPEYWTGVLNLGDSKSSPDGMNTENRHGTSRACRSSRGETVRSADGSPDLRVELGRVDVGIACR